MTNALWFVLALATLFVAEAIYWFIRYFGERRQADLRRRLREVGGDIESGGLMLRRQVVVFLHDRRGLALEAVSIAQDHLPAT